MSAREELKNISWDFYAKLLIIVFALLQIIKWPIAPRFKDIYYHLLSGWGMVFAGGYSGWDFMQYAPVGRVNIYPPFFHILLAVFLKLGITPAILAKLSEIVVPTVFIITLWNFSKNKFGGRLAFFVLLMVYSSNNFFLSLSSHIPSTLALIFGVLTLGQFLNNKISRSVLLLTMAFYTHIGVSWFFAVAIIIFGLFERKYFNASLRVFSAAIIFALPILIKQFVSLKSISTFGFMLYESYDIRIKIFDYILAGIGLFLVWKKGRSYRLFLGLFLAGFIFSLYPYRFFCAEGFLPVIFLSAVTLSSCNSKKFIIMAAAFILFVSPAVALNKPTGQSEIRLKFWDSGFLNVLLTKEISIWYPKEYFGASSIVKHYSMPKEIVFSSFDLTGVIVAAISGRPTANALLPELKPKEPFDGIAVSKVVIFNVADDKKVIDEAVASYGLIGIGRTKAFLLYNNPGKSARPVNQKASVPFWIITVIACVWLALYLCRKS